MSGSIPRGLVSLLAALIIFSLSAVALETELATAVDWNGNEVTLSSDVKANKYLLYFRDEYGVNSNLEKFSPSQMKQFRLAYKEAKRQALALPPRTEGELFSKKFGHTRYTFLGAQPGGDTKMILLLITNSYDVDENTFAIPVKWKATDSLADEYKASQRGWEALLNESNY